MRYWRARSRKIAIDKPVLMGILNVSPDSFSDGGRFRQKDRANFEIDLEALVEEARKMVAQGAAILDVGGESTRPGAEPIDGEEEKRRVLPALRALDAALDVPLSIDSYRPSTQEAALDAGAAIVNDVYAGRYVEAQERVAAWDETDAPEETARIVARRGASVVLMSASGTSRTNWAPSDPDADSVVDEIFRFLERRRDRFVELGVPLENIAFDPGIGFGKTYAQNSGLLKEAREFGKLGGVLLYGCSRKRFVAETLRRKGIEPTLDALDAQTAEFGVELARRGVSVLRVHNVEVSSRALAQTDAAKDVA